MKSGEVLGSRTILGRNLRNGVRAVSLVDLSKIYAGGAANARQEAGNFVRSLAVKKDLNRPRLRGRQAGQRMRSINIVTCSLSGGTILYAQDPKGNMGAN